MDEQKQWWRQWLKAAWHGVIGNTVYDFIKRILTLLWLVGGPRFMSWLQRMLGAAMPTVQTALSTKVVVTVGTITSIAFPVLILAIIWLFFTRKRQSELQSRLREQTTFKAIYYDPDYKESWIKNPAAIADFFAERGFKVVNALQLGRWVDERMEHDESCRSLLVFAQDIVPDTVADLCSDTCKLRMFLDNGGRVVWHGDVPFWYQGFSGRRYEIWMDRGSALVLGVRTSLSDRPLEGTLTEKGRMWGMVLPGPAQRLVYTQEVDDVFTQGPSIDETNTACAWRKIYNPHFPHSGFLRYWPGSRDGQDASINAEYFRFAISGWSAAPEIELPDLLRSEKLPPEQIANDYDLVIPGSAPDTRTTAVLNFGERIAIRTFDGKYVTVDPNKDDSLVARTEQITEWGVFEIIHAPEPSAKNKPVRYGDEVAFKVTSSESFISARLDFQDELKANISWLRGWETFILLHPTDMTTAQGKVVHYGDSFALRANNEKNVSYNANGSGELAAVVSHIQPGETFIFVNPSDPN